MPNVILINAFEVPEGKEEEFLTQWREAAAVLRNAPGYVSTRLHESLDLRAPFRFVNVAEGASPQDFAAAMSSQAFREGSFRLPYAAHPALYRVVVEDTTP